PGRTGDARLRVPQRARRRARRGAPHHRVPLDQHRRVRLSRREGRARRAPHLRGLDPRASRCSRRGALRPLFRRRPRCVSRCTGGIDGVAHPYPLDHDPRGSGRTMAEARRSEDLDQRLAALMLDAVGDAVMATDPNGRILYWNTGAERLYGWTRDEVLGRNIIDVTPSELARDEARAIMERLCRGESWVGEFQVRDKAGRCFLARVSNSPVFDERGELIAIIGVSADVSQRKRMEETLRFLSAAGEALASSLDYEETLRRVPRL